MEPVKPKSIAFLDLESTGLPFSRPRVTEVALVALSMERYRELMSAGHENLPLLEKSLPSGVSTLNFLTNPMKKTSAAWLNGLTDEILANEPPFSKAILRRILDFLGGLAEPVVLVAHNGRRFDFPLLLKEIRLCSAQTEWEEFSQRLLWLDSMKALRAVEKGWYADLRSRALSLHYDNQRDSGENERSSNFEATAVDAVLTPHNPRKRKTTAFPLLPNKIFRRLTRSQTRIEWMDEVEEDGVEVELSEMKSSRLPQVCDLPGSHQWTEAKRRRLALQATLNERGGVEKMKGTGSFSEGKIFAELFPGFAQPNHRALQDTLGLLSISLAYGQDFLHQLCRESAPWGSLHPMQ